MSRFTLCNCLAGFSAAPEWHATDCPGRFGAGKPNTAVVKPTILKDTNVGYAASSCAAVPPAGDVEVLKTQYRVSAGPQTGWSLWGDGNGDAFRNSYQVEVRELVDRAHVTRLEDALDACDGDRHRLRDELTHQKNLCIEAQDYAEKLQALSVTNIMIDIVPGDGSGHEVYAKSVADVEEALSKAWLQVDELETEREGLRAELCARAGRIGSLAGERDAAQSELTNALELLRSAVVAIGEVGKLDHIADYGMASTVAHEISAYLANHPAPAAKDGE